MEVGLSQRLIHPGLIGAQRAAALQEQGDLFELRALSWRPGSSDGLFIPHTATPSMKDSAQWAPRHGRISAIIGPTASMLEYAERR